MRVEELREALADEAARQPPVAPDARQALARHIRHQQARRIGLLGLPAILILVLGAWALLAAHGGGTRVQTASPGPGGLHRLFTRMTPQHIGIEVDRGIIHVELHCLHPTSPRNTCPTDEPGIQAVLSFAGRRDVIPVPDQPVVPGEVVRVLNAGQLAPPSPVNWSAVRTSPEVASVEVDSVGGPSDRMSPVEGYSFFAATTHFGQLVAKDRAGKVVASCSSAIPGAGCTASIGHTVKTSSGSITPHRVVYPATGSVQAERAKDPGTQFALLDLEICPVGDGADLAPDVFLVATGDGQLWAPWDKRIAAREPDLAPVLGPQARGCLRGWLTYEVKAGARIAEVRFTPRRAGSVVWRLP
jgi:hypothetical protein